MISASTPKMSVKFLPDYTMSHPKRRQASEKALLPLSIKPRFTGTPNLVTTLTELCRFHHDLAEVHVRAEFTEHLLDPYYLSKRRMFS
jgi:hypothetical protein